MVLGNAREAEPFSNNPFMLGYDSRIFTGDDDFGFCFPERRLITADGFVTLNETISRIKAERRWKVVLHIGDSSTSGWNANKVYKGCDPLSAFFTYRTYSEQLEDKVNLHSINAGVPGYTSLQGRKYITILLKEFARYGITLDYITIYLGNNEGVYNQIEDKVRIDFMKHSVNHTGERVTITDYKRDLYSIIETVHAYGAKPIFIMPPIRYDWEPGVRSIKHREEFEEALKNWDNADEKERLLQARELYMYGKLKKATEMDRVLPRMKGSYRKALHLIAFFMRTNVIDVQRNATFIDYCHPDEKTCGVIAEQIKKIIWEDYRRELKQEKRMNNKREPLRDVYAGIT